MAKPRPVDVCEIFLTDCSQVYSLNFRTEGFSGGNDRDARVIFCFYRFACHGNPNLPFRFVTMMVQDDLPCIRRSKKYAGTINPIPCRPHLDRWYEWANRSALR